MHLYNKNILLISPEPWSHLFVSKHHYAIELSKRKNKVFFLNPPGNKNEKVITRFDSLYEVNYTGFLRGLKYFPKPLIKKNIKTVYAKLEKLCGVKFDVIWSFDNSVFFDFDSLPDYLLKISHIVDLNMDFNFGKASKTAHVCFSTSEAILRKQLEFNQNSFKINHGYAYSDNENEHVFENDSKIRCLYVGNLDIPYIHWSLFNELVEKYPEIEFLVAGKWDTINMHNRILSNSNFHFLGLIPPEELNSYFLGVDILLLCYDNHNFFNQVSNPHKVMQYLGSGKIVFSKWMNEYENISNSDLILMSRKDEEFISSFDNLIANLDYYNSNELSEERRRFALNNSYSQKILEVESYINKN
ncbi:hypothetical protein OO013_05940 [Mangrovivirga sp. M17]|uniref:Glycosyltransferase n=1 Tax=Mangrovivirga halotolerans TaxID=2993936 RepID=A0ABT3RP77_9BACT|nr:hypothetical protein [Mangrovivirga halotolerans]MCX2743397.1 hypothetical protein [Mangrovivirga halotolerans]